MKPWKEMSADEVIDDFNSIIAKQIAGTFVTPSWAFHVFREIPHARKWAKRLRARRRFRHAHKRKVR